MTDVVNLAVSALSADFRTYKAAERAGQLLP